MSETGGRTGASHTILKVTAGGPNEKRHAHPRKNVTDTPISDPCPALDEVRIDA